MSVAAAGLWMDGFGKDQVRDGSRRTQSGTRMGPSWDKPLIGPALALVVIVTRAESLGTSEKRMPINEAHQFG